MTDQHWKYVEEFKAAVAEVRAMHVKEHGEFMDLDYVPDRRLVCAKLSTESLRFVVETDEAEYLPDWYKYCSEELAERVVLETSEQ